MQVIPSKSGLPTMKVGERLLHSAYDPMKEARREIEAIAADRPTTVVLLGMGLGYAIDAAVERFPRARILVIEADPEIHRLAMATRSLPSGPLVTYVIGRHEAANFASITYAVDAVAMSCIRYLTRLADLDTPFYTSIVDLIGRTSAMQLESLRSTAVFGRLWWENSVRNYREWCTRPDVGGWFGAVRDEPVVIFAAGPSLGDRLDLFAQHDGGIRFVVDTAYETVLGAGVRIDAVFAIDAQPQTLDHFARCAPRRLLAAPVIPPALWGMAQEGMLMSLDGPHFAWFDEALRRPAAHLKSGGSVTTFAFDLARRMGAPEILLVGADFAHRRGRRHVGGTAYERRDLAGLSRFRGSEQALLRSGLIVDGYDTEEALAQYAQWMKWEIGETRSRVTRLSSFGMLEGVPVIEPDRLEALLHRPAPVLPEPPSRDVDPRRLIESFRTEKVSLEMAIGGDVEALRNLSGFFDPITRPFAVASARDGMSRELLDPLLERLAEANAVLAEVIEG